MTLKECFAHFGAVSRNQRWSWSAQSPDGKVVVLTLWKHLIDYETDKGKPTYQERLGEGELWPDKPGNAERLDNLKWAINHCNGIFNVVVTRAEDPKASVEVIAECYPVKWRMKIVELNEETGEFRAIYAE